MSQFNFSIIFNDFSLSSCITSVVIHSSCAAELLTWNCMRKIHKKEIKSREKKKKHHKEILWGKFSVVVMRVVDVKVITLKVMFTLCDESFFIVGWDADRATRYFFCKKQDIVWRPLTFRIFIAFLDINFWNFTKKRGQYHG